MRCISRYTLAICLYCSADTMAVEQGQPPAGKTVEPLPVIGLVLHGLDGQLYQSVENTVRTYQQSAKPPFRLNAGGALQEGDVDVQRAFLRQLLAGHVSGIVLAPADDQALLPELLQARKKGVCVVNIGSRLDTRLMGNKQLVIPWVGPDNRAVAKDVADLVASRLSPGDQVAILAGRPGDTSSFERVTGFRHALKAAGLKVVAIEAAGWQQDRAEKIVAGWLKKYPNLKGVVSAGDNMAVGALIAIEAAGRQNHIVVTGFDNLMSARPWLRNGQLLATVEWFPEKQGIYGINKAMGNCKGNQYTPVALVTAENMDRYPSPGMSRKVRYFW